MKDSWVLVVLGWAHMGLCPDHELNFPGYVLFRAPNGQAETVYAS